MQHINKAKQNSILTNISISLSSLVSLVSVKVKGLCAELPWLVCLILSVVNNNSDIIDQDIICGVFVVKAHALLLHSVQEPLTRNHRVFLAK